MMKRDMSSFSSRFIAGHRLIEQEQVRLHGERAAELDAFLQAVRQPRHRHLADRLDFQEVDDLLDPVAMRDLFVERGADAQELPQEAALSSSGAAGHDVVERAHALEHRDILEGAGDAAAGASWGCILLRVSP